MTPTQDVNIEEHLRSIGFDTDQALRQCRTLLEENRLTRPGKQRISRGKLGRVQSLLAERLARVCSNPICVELAEASPGAGRERLRVSATSCEVCRGSDNRRAVLDLGRHLRRRRVRRLLIIGGTGVLHRELRELLKDQGVELRCVDGADGSHSRRDARINLRWAEIIVVWASTPLPHKVSKLYTDNASLYRNLITCKRRGIAALCQEVTRSCRTGHLAGR